MLGLVPLFYLLGGLCLLLVIIFILFQVVYKVKSSRKNNSNSQKITTCKKTNIEDVCAFEEEIDCSTYSNNCDLLRSEESDRRQLILALLHDHRNTVV